jgi:hypothetical protein
VKAQHPTPLRKKQIASLEGRISAVSLDEVEDPDTISAEPTEETTDHLTQGAEVPLPKLNFGKRSSPPPAQPEQVQEPPAKPKATRADLLRAFIAQAQTDILSGQERRIPTKNLEANLAKLRADLNEEEAKMCNS